MKTIIHVNQHIIKANKKNGTTNAPITVKNYKSNRTANYVEIVDGFGNTLVKILHNQKGLPCGAKVWIETYCKVLTA